MPTLADRLARDFVRYTDDGLPNEPVGHPLPVGDPRSGVHQIKKADLRQLLGAAEVFAAIAEDAAQNASSAAFAFANVESLLASDQSFPAGAVLTTRAGGFSYEVVTTDPDFTTAGGVGMRVVPTGGMISTQSVPMDRTGGSQVTPVMQRLMNRAAATGSELYVSPGTYLCNALIHPSGLTIRGVAGESIIKAAASLPTSSPLLSNEGAAYADTDLVLDGVTFDGNNLGKYGATQSRLTALVRYVKADRVTVRRCTFRDHGYILLSGRSCRAMSVLDNEFTSAGFLGAASNGGSALWLNQTDSDLNRDCLIRSNYFHDNEWHGMQVGGRGIQIVDNRFLNNKETHIFTYHNQTGAPQEVCRDILIRGNIFRGLRRKDISGHGLEIMGQGVIISENIVSDCDHGGIAVENCIDALIRGNKVGEVGKLSSDYAAIDIYCLRTGHRQSWRSFPGTGGPSRS